MPPTETGLIRLFFREVVVLSFTAAPSEAEVVCDTTVTTPRNVCFPALPPTLNGGTTANGIT